ncbi:ferritin-like domain-containing protein [Myxococcus sp. RHSTA-1-4]|uniref:ferritin-like domain-containing protein n=1 Tax=Myxococcus sp. RHSTA-1-4 TaxID=2874601 RepID=UPI001CBFBFFD|nr:ferritin-like domain-containing protein [Myxococcus sp. RHSTA-1-4]MBZ4418464.1 ferritin-like domain-containing protein [Myxococcus sp. RHSTA-1-4]
MAQQTDSQLLSTLKDLLHIDLDAIALYDAVLKTLRSPQIEQSLMEFRSDHLRHVRELNDCIEALGGKREQPRGSVESCERHGFTPIRSQMSIEELITATVDGEQITNRAYERALKENWDARTRALLDRNFADEQRHLLWVLTASRSRLWEQEAAPPSGP